LQGIFSGDIINTTGKQSAWPCYHLALILQWFVLEHRFWSAPDTRLPDKTSHTCTHIPMQLSNAVSIMAAGNWFPYLQVAKYISQQAKMTS